MVNGHSEWLALRVRQTLRRIVGERREEQVREVEGFLGQDQSLVVVDSDGLRVVSNTRRVLRNNTTGILGVFMDDGVVHEERRRNEERVGGMG